MNIQIKWLANLERGKLVVAMLLIGISVLWGDNVYIYRKYEKQIESYKQELIDAKIEVIARTDSFNIQRAKDLADCNEKYEAFLRQQLNKFENTQKRVDSTVKNNNQLLKSIVR